MIRAKQGQTSQVQNIAQVFCSDFILFLSGIFANGHMMYEDKRDKSSQGMPSLKEMTGAAINILQKNKNGYVLVVRIGFIAGSN